MRKKVLWLVFIVALVCLPLAAESRAAGGRIWDFI